MSRPVRPSPRSLVIEWPQGESADEVAEVARLLALRLRAVTEQRGVRAVARETGVSHSIISRVINGEAWADTATLARLELGLDADLWPGRPTRRKSSTHE